MIAGINRATGKPACSEMDGDHRRRHAPSAFQLRYGRRLQVDRCASLIGCGRPAQLTRRGCSEHHALAFSAHRLHGYPGAAVLGLRCGGGHRATPDDLHRDHHLAGVGVEWSGGAHGGRQCTQRCEEPQRETSMAGHDARRLPGKRTTVFPDARRAAWACSHSLTARRNVIAHAPQCATVNWPVECANSRMVPAHWGQRSSIGHGAFAEHDMAVLIATAMPLKSLRDYRLARFTQSLGPSRPACHDGTIKCARVP